jgi:hypothetical protein
MVIVQGIDIFFGLATRAGKNNGRRDTCFFLSATALGHEKMENDRLSVFCLPPKGCESFSFRWTCDLF